MSFSVGDFSTEPQCRSTATSAASGTPVGGDDDHLGIGRRFSDLGNGIDAVPVGQVDIEQHDVDIFCDCFFEPLFEGAHTALVTEAVDENGKTFAHHLIVVDYQDLGHGEYDFFV